MHLTSISREMLNHFILRLLTLLFNNTNWSTLQNAFEIIREHSSRTNDIISQSDKLTHNMVYTHAMLKVRRQKEVSFGIQLYFIDQ